MYKDSPSILDNKVALASDIEGYWGLMKSSIVTVAKELKAEDIVLQRKAWHQQINANTGLYS